MKSLTLATMPLDERHTGVNIASWLEEFEVLAIKAGKEIWKSTEEGQFQYHSVTVPRREEGSVLENLLQPQ